VFYLYSGSDIYVNDSESYVFLFSDALWVLPDDGSVIGLNDLIFKEWFDIISQPDMCLEAHAIHLPKSWCKKLMGIMRTMAPKLSKHGIDSTPDEWQITGPFDIKSNKP